MSRENKGFRRRDAPQRDSQGLSDTLCVCRRLFLNYSARGALMGFVRVFDKCLSKTRVRGSWVQLHESVLIRLAFFFPILPQSEASGSGICSAVRGGCPRVSWSMETPRVPRAKRFFKQLAKRVCLVPGALENLVSNSTSEGCDQCVSVWGWTKEEVWRGGSMSWGKTLFISCGESWFGGEQKMSGEKPSHTDEAEIKEHLQCVETYWRNVYQARWAKARPHEQTHGNGEWNPSAHGRQRTLGKSADRVMLQSLRPGRHQTLR